MTPAEETALIKKIVTDDSAFPVEDTCVEEIVVTAMRLAIRAAVAQESQWREAVLNELIVAHIYAKEHDTNPRKAIHDAITWHCQVAIDPAVSSDARKLIAQERERAAYICDRWSGVGDVVARAIAAAIRRGE